MTPPDKLVTMANQIARAFAHEGEERGADSVRQHLLKFWPPAMRDGIITYVVNGGDRLLPIASRAVDELRRNQGRDTGR